MTDEATLAARQAVLLLEQARRDTRKLTIDFWEAVYQAYVAGFSIAAAAIAVASVLPQDQIGASELAEVTARGPAAIGILVAVAVAVGLRSGVRGGPLVFDAATVQYILQSPVDRAFVARRTALKQLRTAATWGTGAGLALGLGASISLPGGDFWLGLGFASVGLLIGVAMFGSALLVSGRQIGSAAAGAIALCLVAWSVIDTVSASTTSPFTLIGRIGLMRLAGSPASIIGVAVVLGLLLQALLTAGGVSLENSQKRADLVSQIRFALTMQDLRTVVVLRRRLTGRTHRGQLWIPIQRQTSNRMPALQRTIRGLLHSPATTLFRVGILGMGAGAAVGIADRGVTPMALLAGPLLFVAAYDFVEALAQEIDRPSLWKSQPLRPGDLVIQLTVAAAISMTPIAVIAAATATAIGGSSVAGVAVLVFPIATVAAVVGAAVSTLLGTPTISPTTMNTELFAMGAVPRILIPPAIAALPLVPVTVGFVAADPSATIVINSLTAAGLTCTAAVLWLRSRRPGLG